MSGNSEVAGMRYTLLQKAWLFVHDLLRGNRVRVKRGNTISIGFAERLQMEKVDILIKGQDNCLVIGSGSRVAKCKIRIDGSQQSVTVGKNCEYHAGKIYLRYNRLQSIQIGDETTIEDAYLLSDEDASISIGRDCMFSKFVHLRAGDGHSVLDSTGTRINRARDIKIGDHVWIGRGACVLKGAEVPSGSVVGAYAVVTRRFDRTGSAIAGNPATVVREEISWDRRML
ncbi:MAG: acyltransferase [Pseudomonadales bacterium]|nr:acyltransferase [Pseudomonadales bacterium]